MPIEFRSDPDALPHDAFIGLAQRIWPREYDSAKVRAAVTQTRNASAWDGARLVGSVRVLTDGHLFSTVPEVLVDPSYRRRGIGRRLMEIALELAPGGKLFLGAQPGNETFFEACGFTRGPTGYVGRRVRSTSELFR